MYSDFNCGASCAPEPQENHKKKEEKQKTLITSPKAIIKEPYFTIIM